MKPANHAKKKDIFAVMSLILGLASNKGTLLVDECSQSGLHGFTHIFIILCNLPKTPEVQ